MGGATALSTDKQRRDFNMIIKRWRMFQNLINNITGILMFVVMLLIFIQVLIRFVFIYSIPWSEELSRFLNIYIIFLSINLTIRNNMPIKIDFLDSLLNGKVKLNLRILVDIISMLILVVAAYSGYKLFIIGFKSISPGLGIPLYIVYAVIPLGYGLSVIETALQIVGKVKGDSELC